MIRFCAKIVNTPSD